MQENEVIIRKPFDKRNSVRFEEELSELGDFIAKTMQNVDKNPLADFFALSIIISRQQQLAEQMGFECFEDMMTFEENFGVAALLDIDVEE